jgi:glycosyltransferase involved in cell wall biosynthesis
MKILSIIVSFNGEALLPHVLKHYSSFCEKIIVYDNESTDNSVEIIKSFPKAEVRIFGTGGKLDDRENTRIKNEEWKPYKDDFDFVICTDLDELVYHKDGTGEFLEKKFKEGYNLFQCDGWNIVDNHEIDPVKNIFEQYPKGIQAEAECKYAVFNPKEIDINYGIGQHPWCQEKPRGVPVLHKSDYKGLKLLHFKQLSYRYWKEKYDHQQNNLSKFNLDNNLGCYFKVCDLEKVHTEKWYVDLILPTTKEW